MVGPAGETFGKQCTPVSHDTGVVCAVVPRCPRNRTALSAGQPDRLRNR